ncbi:MAG: TetR/AcrR family transcriptional regulator [Comamonadaceae bacterium]|nr:TetR/AcrR family transcriptional regulator [Comamonadaceae bacterium]
MINLEDEGESKGLPTTAGGQETIAKVQNAVLEMLEKQGVLAGINLNEVAKLAGVNRSLVYHHFGTRQGLLRSAIKKRMQDKHALTRTPTEPMPLGDRVVDGLRKTISSADTLRLSTLLHLDGSLSPKLMPNAKTTLLLLDRDRALGLAPDTDDIAALHVSYAAAVYGYALYREVFARDLEMDPAELDTRVEESLRRLFDGKPTETRSKAKPRTPKAPPLKARKDTVTPPVHPSVKRKPGSKVKAPKSR